MYILIKYDNLKSEATKRWAKAVNQSRTHNTKGIRKIHKHNEKCCPQITAHRTND